MYLELAAPVLDVGGEIVAGLVGDLWEGVPQVPGQGLVVAAAHKHLNGGGLAAGARATAWTVNIFL